MTNRKLRCIIIDAIFCRHKEVLEVTIDLTPILTKEVNKLPFAAEGSLTDAIREDDITFTAPTRVSGDITNQAGYLKLTLQAVYTYETSCARCLAPIRIETTLTMEKGLARASSLQNEENDDYLLYTDRTLVLDEALSDLFFLNLPYRHLCREDCAGICPICGKNRNEEPCSCSEKTVDPRLAVLRTLLEDDNQ